MHFFVLIFLKRTVETDELVNRIFQSLRDYQMFASFAFCAIMSKKVECIHLRLTQEDRLCISMLSSHCTERAKNEEK